MKLLNILNGDSTLNVFKQTNLSGDVLVWREVLSEGPLETGTFDEDFFSLRSNWICSAFNSTTSEYRRKVIDEFSRLKDCSEYDEVLLWFEFDLHCQINLIFLLSYLQPLNLEKTKISLICPGDHPNHSNFRGIGELSPEELSNLPSEKVFLNKADLALGSKAWKAYSSGEREQIETFLNCDFGQLDKLKSAFEAHLQRFPNANTGISILEEQLISIVNSGITNRIQVYHEFWKTTAIYGMGDSELDLYLKKLIEQKYIPQLT